MKCELCENGEWWPKEGKNTVTYRGKTTTLTFHYYLCDGCNSEVATPEQTSLNKQIMEDFKETVDYIHRNSC